MKAFAATTLVAALTALPMLAHAEDKQHEGMKGPPNAAGYGSSKQGDTETDKTSASVKMKGPPNANGYEKK